MCTHTGEVNLRQLSLRAAHLALGVSYWDLDSSLKLNWLVGVGESGFRDLPVPTFLPRGFHKPQA